MVIVIPAYEPDEKLTDLLCQIVAADSSQRVVVVDDGSGQRFEPIFRSVAELGAIVLTHHVNRGKGAALKTAFEYVAAAFPGESIVCADCDGQHRLNDIKRVASALEADNGSIVLGSRSFSGSVPARSRLGNNTTRHLFRLATGRSLHDTQTGLRGYSASLLEWLCSVPGERFEYELSVLLIASKEHVPVIEVPADTVYLDANASSHFRPLVDSARVYRPLLRFLLSSFAAFLVDLIALIALMATTRNLAVSVVGARLLSASVNFLTNRAYVFRAGTASPIRASALRYGSLVVAILAANYALMRLTVTDARLPLLVGKALTETVLFTVSFQAQRRWIFRSRKSSSGELQTPVSPSLPHDSARGDHLISSANFLPNPVTNLKG
jgi:glycosyltransferase involved in cell wall biosynthesis